MMLVSVSKLLLFCFLIYLGFFNHYAIADADQNTLKENLRSLRSISISFNQFYVDEKSGKNIQLSFPIRKDITNLISKWGVKVVNPNENPDAILNVSISGKSLSADYVDRTTHFPFTYRRYTGAKISGVVSINRDSVVIFHRYFTEVKKVSESVSSYSTYDNQKNPEDAPFLTTLKFSKLSNIFLELLDAALVDFESMVLTSIEFDQNNEIIIGNFKLWLVEKAKQQTNIEDKLILLLNNDNKDVVISILYIIENNGFHNKELEATLINKLLVFLKSDNKDVTKSALQVIDKLGFNNHLIQESLRLSITPDSSPNEIELYAIELLGKMKSGISEEYLTELLVNNSYMKRRKASAEALGNIGDRKAIEYLISTAISTDDDTLIDICMESLARIEGKSFGNNPNEWASWWERKTGKKIKEYDNTSEQGLFLFKIFLGAVIVFLIAVWFITL